MDILKEADTDPNEPAQQTTLEKAREGMQRALVLADRFDELSMKGMPLYTMADVLQPAIDAVQRFLVVCHHED